MSSHKDPKDEEPAHTLGHFPTLAGIDPGALRGRFARLSVVAQVPIEGGVSRSLLVNVVRLSERSIGKYNSARTHFESYIDRESNEVALTALMECTDDFEDLINSLHRGFIFVEAVRHQGHLSAYAKLELKEVGALIETVEELRHGIEHRDKQLCDQRSDYGAPFLAFGNECVYVGNRSMRIDELAHLVRTLYTVGWSIVQPAGRWIKQSPQT